MLFFKNMVVIEITLHVIEVTRMLIEITRRDFLGFSPTFTICPIPLWLPNKEIIGRDIFSFIFRPRTVTSSNSGEHSGLARPKVIEIWRLDPSLKKTNHLVYYCVLLNINIVYNL